METGQFARSDIRDTESSSYGVVVVCSIIFMTMCVMQYAGMPFEMFEMGIDPAAFVAAVFLVIGFLHICRAILSHNGGRRGMANDLLHALDMLYEIISKQAAKLLKKATDLVTTGKGLMLVEEAPHVGRNLSSLRGMASYEMEVFDFVERETAVGAPMSSSTSSSLLTETVGAPSWPWLEFAGLGAPSSSSLLGISGVRGVGKTTLLRFVRDSYARSGSSVFLVGAGNGCTVGRLQHILSVNIGRPLLMESDGDVREAKAILSGYFRRKTFLLLLDDVRESLDLAAVGLPMPLGHRQKVIFTTRNQAICGEMGCSSIQMECLGEDDAWSLFKDRVGDEIIDAHPHINDLAKKMSAECRGLPSALCALGRAMSTKRDVKEWRYAYDMLKRKMKRPPVNQIQEMDDDDKAYSYLHTLVDELQDSAFF